MSIWFGRILEGGGQTTNHGTILEGGGHTIGHGMIDDVNYQRGS